MEETPARLARSLLREATAEPGRLPELIASAAPRRLGPRAERSVRRLRRDLPDASPVELRARVVARGGRAVAAEGAFVGGPFLVLVPFAFCAALLSQARTVLELAALEGRDPADPARGAELLVLQGVYGSTEAARAALAPSGAGAGSGARGRRPGRFAALWDLSVRMARLLGVVTPAGDSGGLLVRLGGWVLSGAVFLVGLVAPLVWLPYLAFTYHRSTARLMDRATVFYAGAPAPRRTGRFAPAMLLALARALLSLLVPAAAVAVVVITDARIAGGRWPVLGIVLSTTSVAVGGWWLGRRWHRRRG
ncbi:hypothetical protein ACFY7C_01885 [Streptomyces sp. NPDC012769]|uniref:hypothetical protein n=1 Tax=Streptomyces sp. NPDC012769 TaxID=3364848 RepID=UPI0036AE8452